MLLFVHLTQLIWNCILSPAHWYNIGATLLQHWCTAQRLSSTVHLSNLNWVKWSYPSPHITGHLYAISLHYLSRRFSSACSFMIAKTVGPGKPEQPCSSHTHTHTHTHTHAHSTHTHSEPHPLSSSQFIAVFVMRSCRAPNLLTGCLRSA